MEKFNKLKIYKAFLDSKRPVEPSIIRKLEEELKTSYIYNSNAIEGNTLTLKETDVILEYGVTIKGKSLKDHLEVKGQEHAINFLKEKIQHSSELNLNLIKDFHNLLLGCIDPFTAGVFKKYPNSIKNTDLETTSPLHVEYELNKLLERYHTDSTEDIINKIAKFHADFEKIHPFSDGNGRTGRLIMNFELIKHGYPICIIQNDDRLEYYESLKLAQIKQDYGKFTSFIKISLEKTFEFYFKRLSMDWKRELQEFEKK